MKKGWIKPETKQRATEQPEPVDPSGEPAEDERPVVSADINRVDGGEEFTGAEPSEAPFSVAQLEERVQSLRDSLLRAKADYKNLERRSLLERTEAIRYANGELMRSLIGVLDDLERSLAAMDESAAPALDGIRLVYENFVKALRTHGLEPIEALHQPFDPQLHEALLQQPSAEHRPGTVLEEVARGYRLRDRVIRPSKVVVSRAPDGAQPEGTADGQSADSESIDTVDGELEAKSS